MNVRSIIRKSLPVIITGFTLFVSLPVSAGTRNLNLTLKTSSSWLKKTVKPRVKIRLRIIYDDIELFNENVAFSSSKPSVAYVSSTGLITAKKAGSATVTARFRGRKAGVKITVSATSNLSSLRKRIVEYANQFVGVLPYVYGGNSLVTGTDCSGFIHLVLGHFGINTARTASEFQSMSNISYADLRPGDIVVYKNGGHVALYAGNDIIIHAKGSKYGTVKESMWYNTPTGYVRLPV